MSKKNPFVFLDVSIDGDPIERMVFELFSDLVPKTAENFRALCTGEKGLSSKTGRSLHYKGSFFHRIVKGSMAQGGDLHKCDGTNGESIYGEKFPDELPKLKHDEPGLLSMAIADRDTRGSLFSVTFKTNHHLDRKYIVFGKLIHGHEVLKKIENVGDEEGRPTVTVKIIKCGEQENEIQISDKRKSKLKNGKEAYSEANTPEVQHKGKHKKSSKDRRKRRKYYTSESDSSSDTEEETSEYDTDSDSGISSSSSSSDISSSSDDRRKKRKRSSKRDRFKRGKRRDRRRDRRRKKRDKRSKRRSKRALESSTESENEGKSRSNLKDDNGDVHKLDREHKNPAQITAGSQSPFFEETEDTSFHHIKVDAPDMFESEEGEYPMENGERKSNGVDVENRSEKSAERRHDVVDDDPCKYRSRIISPRRTLSKSMSLSPKRSLSKCQSVSPSIGGRCPQPSRRSRSISGSPVRSGSSRSPARSISRSPVRPRKGRSISPSSMLARPRQSITMSPTTSPPEKSPSRSPPRTSSRKSSRKSTSRSPIRSSRRSISRSPVRSSRRSISRSSGRAPSRRSISRSPIRAPVRNTCRSFSRSPVGAGRRARSPYADRGRSISRSPSPEGSPKRIRRGRGFSQRYSYARRYHSPDRSPVRSYRYSRSDRDRYSSYRRSPRRHRTPLRIRTPPRYRGRSRTRSPSVSRSPIRYRNRRYSRSPVRSRSPVETSRYRVSTRVERRRSTQSRSPSESRSSESKSPTRASKEKSSSPSESPPGKKGLVSYGDGSPDSGQR